MGVVGGPEALLSRLPECRIDQLAIRRRLSGGLWHSKYHDSSDRSCAKKLGFDWWRQAEDLAGASCLAVFRNQTLVGGPFVVCLECRAPFALHRLTGSGAPPKRCVGGCKALGKKCADGSHGAESEGGGDGVKSDADRRDCMVCLEGLTHFATLGACEHEFHPACIERWAAESNTCPVCRVRFSCIILHAEDGTPSVYKQVQERDQSARNDEEADARLAQQLEQEWRAEDEAAARAHALRRRRR